MKQHFTDREFELFGTWPGDYSKSGRGKLLGRKMRVFLILCTLAVLAGALFAWVH
jgi:hypothetical protein